MNASELRQGNYIMVDNQKYHPQAHGKIGRVVGIDERIEKDFPKSNASIKFEIGYEQYSQFNEFIKPVPLTEDWLIKFGLVALEEHEWKNRIFNVSGKSVNYTYDYDLLEDKYFLKIEVVKSLEGEIRRIGIEDVPGGFSHVSDIKFVHQLQNLYFALTGNELTIKKTE